MTVLSSASPMSTTVRAPKKFAQWLSAQESPPCDCGCGGQIVLKPHHRKYGIPRFIAGHQSWARYPTSKDRSAWILEQQGKHLCRCGCGKKIKIRGFHFLRGIPKYLHGHQPRRRLRGALNPRYVADRSQLKAARPEDFSPWAKQIIYEAFGGRCAWCGVLDLTEFDHVIPCALGGTSDPSNGQLLCPTCHRWKTSITVFPRRKKNQPDPIETEDL